MNNDFSQYENRTSDAPTLGAGWLPLSTGPKDGSLVEIECRYGIKPWRALAKWTALHGREGWWTYPQFNGGPFALHTCFWRPFAGDPESHVDPYEAIDDFDYYMGKRPVEPRGPSVIAKLLRAVFGIGRDAK